MIIIEKVFTKGRILYRRIGYVAPSCVQDCGIHEARAAFSSAHPGPNKVFREIHLIGCENGSHVSCEQ